MQYWLMKSEPDVWSIDQQKKAGAKGAMEMVPSKVRCLARGDPFGIALQSSIIRSPSR